MLQAYYLPTDVSDLFTQIAATGKVTTTDCHDLMARLSDLNLSQGERQLADRILYGLRRGWLELDDEVSLAS